MAVVLFGMMVVAGAAVIGVGPAAAATAGEGSGQGSSALRKALSDPEWPCVQIQVPTLASGQIWTGDPIDGRETNYQQSPDLVRLVGMATNQRVSVEAVEAAISEAAASWASGRMAATEQRTMLTDLFAGIFATSNSQRAEMLAAIKAFARQQRQRLDEISAALGELSKLPAGSAEAENLSRAIEFQRRIVDERRRSQTAICEQPVRLERRLGRLSRSIAGHLPMVQ